MRFYWHGNTHNAQRTVWWTADAAATAAERANLDMLELLFPTELRRLSYLTRVLPLHAFLFAAFANLGSADEFTLGETLLCIATITAVLYTVGFVYLPRARDAGLPAWTLLFGLLPLLSNALGLLLAFRRSRHARLGPRDVDSPRKPVTVTVAGSHCAVCNKRLIFQTEGLINESNEVICNECRASPQPPACTG